MLLTTTLYCQKLPNIKVSESQLEFLGKTKAVRDLIKVGPTTVEQKEAYKKHRTKPDNFKGRGFSKVMLPELEHQGVDPLRKIIYQRSPDDFIFPDLNIDGLGPFESPHDPTGDVGQKYYLQATNITFINVYDKTGRLVESFSMNTLWQEFETRSGGDPIILYDETAEKWFISELTREGDLLIAISETSDPLGRYFAYRFQTPEFSDYPKYGIYPGAYSLTTNEGGAGILHNYFFERAALISGAEEVKLQRIEVEGNSSTEAGFFVSTPVDWNGDVEGIDTRPISLALNDASWGTVTQDQIELYAFDIDWVDAGNTTVERQSIVNTPFDSYPCSAVSLGFACVQQKDDDLGLDALPELIMNVPHHRHFIDHESIVFTFITDVTDGENLSGIRWTELRKYYGQEWILYQEGTFAPDNNVDRYIAGIAIDKYGDIGMAYNYSSVNDYVGIRLTGRQKGDPLGQMSFNETEIVTGINPIYSSTRFGDYCQMSIEEGTEDRFWYTAEYAGDSNSNSHTRIISFQMPQEEIDLNAMHLNQPLSFKNTNNENEVIFTVANQGRSSVESYEVGVLLNGNLIETKSINNSLPPGVSQTVSFDNKVIFENINGQSLTLFVNADQDANPNNDTINVPIFNIITNNVQVQLNEINIPCGIDFQAGIVVKNKGGNIINELVLEVILNSSQKDTINWQGELDILETDLISFNVLNSLIGENDLTIKVLSVNNQLDMDQVNNVAATSYQLNDPSTQMNFNLMPDNFPLETSWQLVSDWNNEVVYMGDAQDLNNVFQLLPDSCYTFTIFDSEGDGICCTFGEGFYSLANGYCDTIISSNGDFEDEETFSFCFESNACVISVDVAVRGISQEGADDGTFEIRASNAAGPIRYSIDGGQTFSDNPNFTGLAQGDYDLVINYNDSSCIFMDLISVGVFSSTTDINKSNARIEIKPNPNNGYFQVELYESKNQGLFTNLEIYNAMGKLIERKRMQNYSGVFKAPISLVAFPDGHYYIKVFNKEEYLVETVIKNR